MVNCEFELCIYCENNKCILDKINISNCGMCEDCITVTLPTEILQTLKRELLEKYDLLQRVRMTRNAEVNPE